MSNVSETHSFISFRGRWKLDEDTIFRLGQCKAIIRSISHTPIMPRHRREIFEVSLIKGAQATTAIEGNTLSEEEIERIHKGKPIAPSKRYMEDEVRNVLEALNTLLVEIVEKRQATLVTPDLVRRFHYMIGHDLGKRFEAVPGQFRKGEVTVGRHYRPPLGRDVDDLMKRFCLWIRQEFHYEKGQTFSSAVLQAIVCHVYVAWIHPFDDGNGRTARLLEFYLLLRAGVPDVAAHILSNHYNLTRDEYYAELRDTSEKHQGDLSAFIRYSVQGFKDGLQAVLDTVNKSQMVIAWRNYVHEEVYPMSETSGRARITASRQSALALSLEFGRAYRKDELFRVNEAIKIAYADIGARTRTRDVRELEANSLIVKDPESGLYSANVAVLQGSMARAREDKRIE